MSHPTRAPFALDPLEPRQLLAVDLAVAFRGFTLPKNARAGAAQHGTATVVITNLGADPVPSSTTPTTVDVNTFPGLHPGQFAETIGSVKHVKLASLAPNKKLILTIPLTIPATAVGGRYQLNTSVLDPSVTESNYLNNVATAKARFALGTFSSALLISSVSSTMTAVGQANTTASVTVGNTSGKPIAGTADVVIMAAANDATLPVLTLATRSGVKVKLAAHKSLTVANLHLKTIPLANASGTRAYTLFARVIPHVQPDAANPTPSVLADPDPVDASADVVSFGTANDPIPSHFGLGAQLTFAAGTTTSSPGIIPGLPGPTTTTGALTDNAAHTGTYTYTSGILAGLPGTLTLSFPASSDNPAFARTYGFVTFLNSNTIDTLAGHAFTLSKTDTNAAARFQFLSLGSAGDFYYLDPVS